MWSKGSEVWTTGPKKCHVTSLELAGNVVVDIVASL